MASEMRLQWRVARTKSHDCFKGEHADAEQIRFHGRQENNLIFLTRLLTLWHGRALLCRIPSCSGFAIRGSSLMEPPWFMLKGSFDPVWFLMIEAGNEVENYEYQYENMFLTAMTILWVVLMIDAGMTSVCLWLCSQFDILTVLRVSFHQLRAVASHRAWLA